MNGTLLKTLYLSIVLCSAVSVLRADDPTVIHVNSPSSMVHLGSIDSFEITEKGTEAARFLIDYLERDNKTAAELAIQVYERIIPIENFGGEYTALKWFAELFLMTDEEKAKVLEDELVKTYYDALAEDNFAPLREFLKRKYHLGIFGDESSRAAKQRERVLEDFVVFQNPVREEWEKTRSVIECLELKPGDKIVDFGCGPGFYTFRFLDDIGDEGHVYGIDIREEHIEYVTNLAEFMGVDNVTAINAPLEDVTLGEKVDYAFCCSLYHVVYSTFNVAQSDAFLATVKKVLKPGGTFVIVDNALVDDQTLPYHGPYISRELVIAQMHHYGFKLHKQHQFIPQRYVLEFKLDEELEAEPNSEIQGVDRFSVTNRVPLVYIPTAARKVTDIGTSAAENVLKAIRGDREAAEQAIEIYERIAPIEDLGGDYTALQWFCEYLIADESKQKEMLSDWFVKEYFDYLTADDFRPLRTYLESRYSLSALTQEELNASNAVDDDAGLKRRAAGDIRDFVLFNNPNRESWEKTSKVIELMDLKPGEVVADIGCGPGYYTFQFSRLVGPTGKVFAADTNDEIVDYVTSLAFKHEIRNVETITSKLDNTMLPKNSTDVIFLCSLYHVIYTGSLEPVKDRLVSSMKQALRPGGRIIIVDNNVSDGTFTPYTGAAIDKRLIVAQMKHYGFKLVKSATTIPQRYYLEFELE